MYPVSAGSMTSTAAVSSASYTGAPDTEASAVADIFGEIERLSVSLTYAEERLSKVLGPSYGSSENSTSVPTPVQSVIREARDSLGFQINRLNELVARIEA